MPPISVQKVVMAVTEILIINKHSRVNSGSVMDFFINLLNCTFPIENTVESIVVHGTETQNPPTSCAMEHRIQQF